MSGRLRLVLASANPDKAAEIRTVLRAELDDAVELVPRPPHVPDVVEDGTTLMENARLKAAALSRATESAAVADDTGLEVHALGGAPGVYSARFAGHNATYDDNVAHLLAELDRVGAMAPDDRRARFCTVALVRFPDGTELVAEGVVDGVITTVPRGDGGFGYDPVFLPDLDDGPLGPPAGLTFAEMQPHHKHAVSHRGRAFRALAEALARYTSPG